MVTTEQSTASKVFLVKTKINPSNATARFVETVEINGNPCVGRAYLINRKESRQPPVHGRTGKGQENSVIYRFVVARQRDTVERSYQKFLSTMKRERGVNAGWFSQSGSGIVRNDIPLFA